MPADYRLVSYTTAEKHTPHAGILLDGRVTDARDVLGAAGGSVLDILRDWPSASQRLEGFACGSGSEPLGAVGLAAVVVEIENLGRLKHRVAEDPL